MRGAGVCDVSVRKEDARRGISYFVEGNGFPHHLSIYIKQLCGLILWLSEFAVAREYAECVITFCEMAGHAINFEHIFGEN
mmetsp:Transcript_1625/g.2785  ORF Transcript_1625/g.2785 Transcript_1625/m.2785 type:complete len:81 (-) Transcript_1625:294-536(-)